MSPPFFFDPFFPPLARCGSKGEAPLFLQAIAHLRRTAGDEHHWVAEALFGLGRLRFEQGRLEDAETLYQKALAMRENIHGPNHPDVAEVATAYAALLRRAGRSTEADQMEARAAR